MKNSKLIIAAILGAIALATVVLFLRASMNAETLIAYGSVIVILALAAVDYRIRWSQVFNRRLVPQASQS
ncbi:MAG TPA: hypothetical protein VL069_10670 [Opitutus sp.]|nr:hypothetical protein [Opitutus sp.]